jgi:hypothetical protein
MAIYRTKSKNKPTQQSSSLYATNLSSSTGGRRISMTKSMLTAAACGGVTFRRLLLEDVLLGP